MPERSEQTAKSSLRRRVALLAAAIVAGLAVGFAGVYGIGAFKPNGDPACAGKRRACCKSSSLWRTAKWRPSTCRTARCIYQISLSTMPPAMPSTSPIGAAAPCCSTCGPPGACRAARKCRRSTPCKSRPAGKIFRWSRSISTPAISTSRRPGSRRSAFHHLDYFADPSAKVFQDLKAIGRAFGMPTTLLIDPNGCELGTIAGPAEWASEDALKLIKAAVGAR